MFSLVQPCNINVPVTREFGLMDPRWDSLDNADGVQTLSEDFRLHNGIGTVSIQKCAQNEATGTNVVAHFGLNISRNHIGGTGYTYSGAVFGIPSFLTVTLSGGDPAATPLVVDVTYNDGDRFTLTFNLDQTVDLLVTNGTFHDFCVVFDGRMLLPKPHTA